MNKIFRRIISVSLSLFFVSTVLTSCIEEYNADLPSSESDLLVVEGTILSDTISTFYLSLTMPLNYAQNVNNVTNATIQLQGSDGTRVDAVSDEPGTYKIATPKLNTGTRYKIIINYNGDTYETEEQTPFPTNGVQNLEFNQKTPDDAVDILITTDVPINTSETQYYRWTYQETYEVHPEYRSYWTWNDVKAEVVYNAKLYPARGWVSAKSVDIIASSSAYYSNNQIVQYKLYDIENTNRRLYVAYSTEVIQRSLTKAEYEYENERRKISTDMGGLFTPQPSSLPTNIRCTTNSKHVLGYVGCALNVARYRLFIYPDQVNVINDYKCIDRVTEGGNQYFNEHINHSIGYKLWLYEKDPSGSETFHWTSPECVDIRILGATTEKPDFWKERITD